MTQLKISRSLHLQPSSFDGFTDNLLRNVTCDLLEGHLQVPHITCLFDPKFDVWYY